jgi:hypothetical protein
MLSSAILCGCWNSSSLISRGNTTLAPSSNVYRPDAFCSDNTLYSVFHHLKIMIYIGKISKCGALLLALLLVAAHCAAAQSKAPTSKTAPGERCLSRLALTLQLLVGDHRHAEAASDVACALLGCRDARFPCSPMTAAAIRAPALPRPLLLLLLLLLPLRRRAQGAARPAGR